MCSKWVALVLVIACPLFGAKPLPKPTMTMIWSIKNKLQWNFNQNSTMILVICKIAVILLRPQICHYSDAIMTTRASQISSLAVVYSTVYSDADQRKHQNSAPLAFVWGIHRDRWIPRTKGQLRGKCFHLMTSSCNEALHYGQKCGGRNATDTVTLFLKGPNVRVRQ